MKGVPSERVSPFTLTRTIPVICLSPLMEAMRVECILTQLMHQPVNPYLPLSNQVRHPSRSSLPKIEGRGCYSEILMAVGGIESCFSGC